MGRNTDIDSHILHIVRNVTIREQIELQTQLKERGFEIPQATLSRRLKKLKIVKVDSVYEIIDKNPRESLPSILHLKVSDAGIIVLHTLPGCASSLAFFLDQKYVTFTPKDNKASPILGTIAGDDTVIVIAKNIALIDELLEIFYRDFPYLKGNISDF